MKRLHVHLGVADLEQSIRFYSALFAAEPSVNFAISTRGKKAGLDHLGIQAEDDAELEQLGARLAQPDMAVMPQKNASCCYPKRDKYWTLDPQGIAWESFHTLDAIPVFGADTASQAKAKQAGASCAPTLREPV